MPPSVAPALPDAPTPRAARRHLFGAVGSLAEAITRTEREQRQRASAEAQRVSGNFYVDRLVGSVRTR